MEIEKIRGNKLDGYVYFVYEIGWDTWKKLPYWKLHIHDTTNMSRLK